MRKTFIPLLFIFACAREQGIQPPRMPDLASKLRRAGPPEHPPKAWMFGCYTTAHGALADAAAPPEQIQLTATVTNPEAPVTFKKYEVLGQYRKPVRGEWSLMSTSTARVGIGVPFQGPWWVFDVQLTPQGGEGTVKFMTDADVSREPVPTTLTKVPCR